MPSIQITNPTNSTTVDANAIASIYLAITALVNGGLDNSNFNASAALAVSKLASGANGQFLAPDNAQTSWTNDLQIVTKTQQSGSSDSTYRVDDELKITVEANTVWIIQGVLYAAANSSCDIKFGLKYPDGTTGQWYVEGPGTGEPEGSSQALNIRLDSATLSATSTSSDQQRGGVKTFVFPPVNPTATESLAHPFWGLLRVTQGGSVQIQFAQLTTTHNEFAYLMPGSHMRALRIS